LFPDAAAFRHPEHILIVRRGHVQRERLGIMHRRNGLPINLFPDL